jgi:hypothetical protein
VRPMCVSVAPRLQSTDSAYPFDFAQGLRRPRCPWHQVSWHSRSTGRAPGSTDPRGSSCRSAVVQRFSRNTAHEERRQASFTRGFARTSTVGTSSPLFSLIPSTLCRPTDLLQTTRGVVFWTTPRITILGCTTNGYQATWKLTTRLSLLTSRIVRPSTPSPAIRRS